MTTTTPKTTPTGQIDPRSKPVRRKVECLFVSVFMLWFLLWFIPLLLIVGAFGTYVNYLLILLLPLYAYTSYFTGDDSNAKHKRRWSWFCNSFVMSFMGEYFSQRFINECELRPDKQYIIGVHPHGILGFNCNPLTGDLFNYLQRTKRPTYPRVVVASVLFRMPGIREFFLWQGYCNASRKTVRDIVESGQDCAIIVGGSKEVLESKPKTDVLYLNRRKGFIRIALETGSDLVPVYAFGHNDCYDQFLGFKKIQLKLISAFQALIPIFYGRWYTFVPFKAKMTVVMGEPIVVEKCTTPTNEQIDAIHREYTKRVVDLFEKWKVEAGYDKTRKLTIL